MSYLLGSAVVLVLIGVPLLMLLDFMLWSPLPASYPRRLIVFCKFFLLAALLIVAAASHIICTR